MWKKNKVAVMLADGFEEIEALTVVDIVRRSGIDCDMVSIKDECVEGCHGVCVKADEMLDDLKKDDYSIVVLPGGLPGADNLMECDELISWIQELAENSEKYVAAICAAPQVLARAGVVKGKKVTSYPAGVYRDLLKEADYIDDSRQEVVVDGNIITSRGPATAMAFAYKLVELLGGDAEALRSGMLYSERK